MNGVLKFRKRPVRRLNPTDLCTIIDPNSPFYGKLCTVESMSREGATLREVRTGDRLIIGAETLVAFEYRDPS